MKPNLLRAAGCLCVVLLILTLMLALASLGRPADKALFLSVGGAALVAVVLAIIWIAGSVWWRARRPGAAEEYLRRRRAVQAGVPACSECEAWPALVRCDRHGLWLCRRCFEVHHQRDVCVYSPASHRIRGIEADGET